MLKEAVTIAVVNQPTISTRITALLLAILQYLKGKRTAQKLFAEMPRTETFICRLQYTARMMKMRHMESCDLTCMWTNAPKIIMMMKNMLLKAKFSRLICKRIAKMLDT